MSAINLNLGIENVTNTMGYSKISNIKHHPATFNLILD